MDDQEPFAEPIEERINPPAFNVPMILVWLIAGLIGVHVLRYLLDARTDLWVVFAFGFLPGRYVQTTLDMPMPLGVLGDLLGPVTYTFLHGSWLHLFSNSIWLLAFGAPVAQRFRAVRFLALGAVCSIFGALAHLVTHWGEMVPVIGASAAVSGYMGAAIRFAFSPGGPLTRSGRADPQAAIQAPAAGILGALANRNVLLFMAVWFGFNLIFGLGAVQIGGIDAEIAWEAHMGGFLAGLLLFKLFDPVRDTVAA
ncbi:rhomboid family intramembrane serine protease [Tepidamorphus sp. 3E244]|uniref:rhomboid family intramembrane serine protease n=1 Tax=Tepidamorphus sp. 3E244 TaxID=3385498 RepID=UPI0038FCAB3F